MTNQLKFKRRLLNNILIQKDFQLRLVSYASIIFASYTVLIFTGVAFFSWKFQKMGEAAGFPPNHSFFSFINEQKISLLIFYSIASIIGLIILISSMLKLSHRVAGPIYRLNQHLKSIADDPKKLRTISFRKGDYFQDVADDLNNTIGHIEDSYKNDLVYLSEVNSYINNLSLVVPDDKRVVLNEISSRLSEIQKRFTNEN